MNTNLPLNVPRARSDKCCAERSPLGFLSLAVPVTVRWSIGCTWNFFEAVDVRGVVRKANIERRAADMEMEDALPVVVVVVGALLVVGAPVVRLDGESR